MSRRSAAAPTRCACPTRWTCARRRRIPASARRRSRSIPPSASCRTTSTRRSPTRQTCRRPPGRTRTPPIPPIPPRRWTFSPARPSRAARTCRSRRGRPRRPQPVDAGVRPRAPRARALRPRSTASPRPRPRSRPTRPASAPLRQTCRPIFSAPSAPSAARRRTRSSAARAARASTTFAAPCPGRRDDPFAPLGLRLGSFTLYSTLEQSFGTSDNLTNTLDGVRGAFSETAGSVRLLSNWDRHEAEINALASFRRNDSGPLQDVPRIDLDARLRLDMSRDWTATLRGALRFDRDDPLVSGPATAEASTRDILAYSAGATLARDVGRLHNELDLSAVREDRDDGLFDGTVRRLDDSFTTWSAGLRTGYDATPALRPFVAASVGRRLFDETLLGSPSRDSVIPALRGGVGFDWGEKLSGDVAVGYAWNVPDDDRLGTQASPTIDARVKLVAAARHRRPPAGRDLLRAGHVGSGDLDALSGLARPSPSRHRADRSRGAADRGPSRRACRRRRKSLCGRDGPHLLAEPIPRRDRALSLRPVRFAAAGARLRCQHVPARGAAPALITKKGRLAAPLSHVRS